MPWWKIDVARTLPEQEPTVQRYLKWKTILRKTQLETSTNLGQERTHTRFKDTVAHNLKTLEQGQMKFTERTRSENFNKTSTMSLRVPLLHCSLLPCKTTWTENSFPNTLLRCDFCLKVLLIVDKKMSISLPQAFSKPDLCTTLQLHKFPFEFRRATVQVLRQNCYLDGLYALILVCHSPILPRR